MTYGINTFEAGVADETAVDNTTVLTGLTSGFTMVRSLAGGGTAKFDTATPHRGSLAVRLDAPAATDIARLDLTGLSSTAAVLEPYIRLSAYPAAEAVLMQIKSTLSVAIAAVAVTAAGMCRLYDGSGAAVWLGSTALPLNQYIRFSLGATVGTASASPYNGALRFEYYTGSGLETSTATETATWSGSSTGNPTAANTGTLPVNNMRVGKLGTSVAWSGITVDDLQFNDAIYTGLGPVTGTLPVIADVIDNIWRLTVTGSSGSPTFTLVQLSGPTVQSITQPSAGVFEVKLPTSFTTAITVRLTATNAAGSVTKDYTISPTGSSSTVIVRDRLRWNGTTWA